MPCSTRPTRRCHRCRAVRWSRSGSPLPSRSRSSRTWPRSARRHCPASRLQLVRPLRAEGHAEGSDPKLHQAYLKALSDKAWTQKMSDLGIHLLPEAKYAPGGAREARRRKWPSGARSRPTPRSRSTDHHRHAAPHPARGDLADSLARALQFISHHHPPDLCERCGAPMPPRPRASQGGDRADPGQQPARGARSPAAMPGLPVSCRCSCVSGGGAVCSPRWAEHLLRCNGWPMKPCVVPIPVRSIRCGLRWCATRWANARNAGQHPAIVHTELVGGDRVEVLVAAKGGGGDVKSSVRNAEPERQRGRLGDRTTARHGCRMVPPGVLGIGIGGSPGQAMLLCQTGRLRADRHRRAAAAPDRRSRSVAAGTARAHQRARHRGPGPGWAVDGARREGGHGSLPRCGDSVALVPNCAATRCIRFTLDRHGTCAVRGTRRRTVGRHFPIASRCRTLPQVDLVSWIGRPSLHGVWPDSAALRPRAHGA